MNKRLSYREKKMFFICLGMIASYAIFYWVIKPIMLHVRTLEEEIQEKQRALIKNSKKMAVLRDFEEDNISFLKSLKVADADNSMALFISKVEQTSKKFDLKITDLKPQKIKEEEFLVCFSLNILAQGSFFQVLEFIHTLEKSPNYFMLDEVSLENNGIGQDDFIKARIILSKKLIR